MMGISSLKMGYDIASGYVKQFANLKMAIEIDDLPINSMVDLSIVM